LWSKCLLETPGNLLEIIYAGLLDTLVLVTVTVVSVGVSDSDASVTSGVSVAIFMNFGLLPTKWEFLKLGWCLLSLSTAC